ncbi:MAG TPA: hypothetical protein VIS49_11590 [Cyclobacteriaceae bacterium]
MDFQFWIWLIVIVITLIARANKKKQGQAPPTDELPDFSGDSQSSRQPKAVTFEDLLREIQGEKERSKPVRPEPKVEKKYDFVDYDDDIPEEIQDLEDVDYNVAEDVDVFKKYEEAQKEAENELISEKKEGVGRIIRSEHFKEYDLKKKRASFNFLNELKDPKGFKKAFIMSEILNKKY